MAVLQFVIQVGRENILLNQIPCLLSVCSEVFLLLFRFLPTRDYKLLPEFFLIFELFVDKRDLFIKEFDIYEVFLCNDSTGCFLLFFLCVLRGFNAIWLRLLLLSEVGPLNVEQKLRNDFVLRPLVLLFDNHIWQCMEGEEMFVHYAFIFYLLSESIEYV